MAEDALDRLSDDLRTGRIEMLTGYLSAMARLDSHSWNNVLLIHAQRPTATRVETYHAWRDLGRFVNKGEKGIAIEAPSESRHSSDSRRAGPNGRPHPDKFPETQRRSAYVFDVEQTHGKPLSRLPTTPGDPQTLAAKLKAIAIEHGVAWLYDDAARQHAVVSSRHEIRLPSNPSTEAELLIIAHQLAHQLLHQRLAPSELHYVMVEAEAEATAFVVMRRLGLPSPAAGDFVALYEEGSAALADSLAVIHDASRQISNELLSRERTALMDSDRAPSETRETRFSARPDPSDSGSLER